MRSVFVVSDNIVSPLGFTTEDNFSQLKSGMSGIKQHSDPDLSEQPFYASLLDKDENLMYEQFRDAGGSRQYTKFELLLILSIEQALSTTEVRVDDKRTVLIISSTKGNISLLETHENNQQLKERVALHSSGRLVAGYFNSPVSPVIISNACISGSLAILTGVRLIQSGRYDHAVIAGADVISKFVFSGFGSFQALSAEPCKPFDAKRNGITLGEGAGTIVLSSSQEFAKTGISIAGGSVSNDANHISGPSRTGMELSQAIQNALQQASLDPGDIDFISAHGTATMYNDEMEANAITLSNLQSVPVNSLKGYYGHTLGAAGLIESIISIHSLKENLLIPTIGFKEPGVTKPLNVYKTVQSLSLKNFLKTASGFGGCNAALVISKQN